MRYDFSRTVKDVLAKRVGLRCSNPWCGRPTSGPSNDTQKAVNLGVAAHITAASSGGPRYDQSLTPGQRKSQENAIWLCQFCSALIDKDPELYTVEAIRGWKRVAEEASRLKVERPAYVFDGGGATGLAYALQTRPSLADTVRISGQKPLGGTVVVSGAKNAISKQIVASLLTSEKCTLFNVAPLADVVILAEIIQLLGGKVQVGKDERSLDIDTGRISATHLPRLNAFDGRSRVNILLLAPLLHRFGKAIIPEQGGCNLGGRGIDYHLEIISAMGAKYKRVGKAIHASARGGLKGAVIELPQVSVGATEQALLAGALAKGVTVIRNAALVPEVLDLVKMLNQMGADVATKPSREIYIKGAERLCGFRYNPMPDRSEVGSWASLALATGSTIRVKNARIEDIVGLQEPFEKAGGGITPYDGGLLFHRRLESVMPVTIQTGSHPAFLTDWQPPFLVALTQAAGTSVIHETVFSDRLGFVPALQKMNARVEPRPECLGTVACHFASGSGQEKFQHSAIINGPSELIGSEIRVDELRGGFACIIAALVARGDTTIRNFSSLQKGYDSLLHKLLSIGAHVTPVDWLSNLT
jgi:UDP-N-acetylglucosamine 1-carboxyvinyltransferase